MLKRLLSFAVALVMVIGLMPWNAVNAYATDDDTATEPEIVAETTEPVTVADETTHVAYNDSGVYYASWSELQAEISAATSGALWYNLC